jgi:uncharacterized protein YkwD
MGVSRKRRWALLAAVVLGIAAVGAACGEPPPPPPPPPNCPTGPQNAIASTIYSRTNIDRANQRLNALAWDPTLACNAQGWSIEMSRTGNFWHQNLGALIRSGGYSNFASLGENILVGPSSMNGDDIHVSWMNSPGHFANIMGWFDSIGIGIIHGADGRVWATEEFGRHF